MPIPALFLQQRTTLLAAALCVATTAAHAHSVQMDCKADGPQHVLCQGSFSDGSDAAGVEIIVMSYEDKILHKGTLDGQSRLRFERPSQDFFVQMDAGEGHTVEIDHAEIR